MRPSCCAPKRPVCSASLTAMAGVLHALPLAYSKDLQEDKEALFDAVDTIELSLEAAERMLAGVRFDRERLAAAAADEMVAATDVADLLVRKGMPFREAHAVVGGLVRSALDRGVSLSELEPDELGPIPSCSTMTYYTLLSAGGWIESKRSRGGTGSAPLAAQIEAARDLLADLAGTK